MRLVKTKSAREISTETIKMLRPYKDKVHTITADNVKEFANHKRITRQLDTKVYFAHPYHSWERGLNENTNGLIRQYFPKGTSFEGISQEKAVQIQEKLNNRPRKKLNFIAPIELFNKQSIIVFKNNNVALNT